MEYGRSKRFPKHGSDLMGAIFMCNNFTKKECFERKLFGLPSEHSDFVKEVKTDMILFLFEPDERKLNGVFQATSDGAMNIIPSAFSTSRRRFPAQVRFGRLCACKPLSENEFREAIEENYVTPMKFTFALSCQQLCDLGFLSFKVTVWLIWLFSSRSCFPHDQFSGGLQIEFMKIFENSSLSRNSVSGSENLLKFDAAGYNMDNNISTRNTVLSGPSKNRSASYEDRDLHDITLQNHLIQGQHEPYPAGSHTVESQQLNQMLSTSCNDHSWEDIPVNPTGHPSYSSSRFLYKQPSIAFGMDLREKKLTFCSRSSLDAQTPHIRSQSYTRTPHIRTKDFPLTNYPGIDISKCSRISKPSQLTLHAPEGHVNFHDFSQKVFPENYDLSNNKLSVSPPGRLWTMASTSLCLRNAEAYSQPTRHEVDSWSQQDWPSGPLPDYIPISEGEALVNNGYIPVLEDENVVNSKEVSELQSKKENWPLALNYDFHSDFTRDTNNTGKDSFDFSYYDRDTNNTGKDSFDFSYYENGVNSEEVSELPSRKENCPLALNYDYQSSFTRGTNNIGKDSFDFYYDKKSASDSNVFPPSDVFQKRCSVFGRLSRPPKKFKYPSLDHMLELLCQRSKWTKMSRKPKNLENFETDIPLDNIVELGLFEDGSLVGAKPQIEEFNESNGFSFPNFKRRSVVIQQNTGTSDFTECVGKCKKRKIIRPSFSEEDNSSQDKDNCQNHNCRYFTGSSDAVQNHNISSTLSSPGIKGSVDFRNDNNITEGPAREPSLSKESVAHGEGSVSVGYLGLFSSNLQDDRCASSTDSLTVNIQGSQQTLGCHSEVCDKFPFNLVARESGGKESEKINTYSIMCDKNVDAKPEENSCALPVDVLALPVEKHSEHNYSTGVSTSNAIVSHGVPEKDSAANTVKEFSGFRYEPYGSEPYSSSKASI